MGEGVDVGIWQFLGLVPYKLFGAFDNIALSLLLFQIFLSALLQQFLALSLVVELLLFGNIGAKGHEHLRVDFLLGVLLHKGRLTTVLQECSCLLNLLLRGQLQGRHLLQHLRVLVGVLEHVVNLVRCKMLAGCLLMLWREQIADL